MTPTTSLRPFRVGDRVRFEFADWGALSGVQAGIGTVSEVRPARPWRGEMLPPFLVVHRDEARTWRDLLGTVDVDAATVTTETFHLNDAMTAHLGPDAVITMLTETSE